MTRNRFADFAVEGPMSAGATNRNARNKLRRMAGNPVGKAVGVARKAVGAVKANPGKAGMALAGLAAAGGLGMAGLKAVGARKKKANSLQGRLSSAMKKRGR